MPVTYEKIVMTELSQVDMLELLMGTSLVKPNRLTDISSWHRHIPFGFALMRMMRPHIFVELGTHRGDSYFAMCQARKEFGLDTKCFAVDTWAGDSQAGYYGDEVYEEVRAVHGSLYSDFSTLLRMRFHEALSSFADGSVDLLHIDGLHTYEAVKEDFESWLPKMSRSGVILFHDTNVLDRDDFGVWRLWREITDGRLSFEFKFGHGLGVLATGNSVPKSVSDFLKWANAEPEIVSHFFWLQGSDLELRNSLDSLQHRDELGQKLSHAQSTIAQRDAQLANANQLLKDTGEQLSLAQSVVYERDEQLDTVNQLLADTGERLSATQSIVSERDTQLQAVNRLLEEIGEQLSFAQNIIAERDERLEFVNDLLAKTGDRLTHAQGVVAQRDKQLESLNKKLSRITQRLSNAQDTGALLETKLRTYRDRHERLMGELKSAEAAILNLEEQSRRMSMAQQASEARLKHISASRWWRAREFACRFLGRG